MIFIYLLADKGVLFDDRPHTRGHRSDVDSRCLQKNNAQTLLELIREIGMSYFPAIVALLITFMYDVKEWLEGCAIPNLSGHIHQHQFKLVRAPDGKARLFYKKWSTTPTWSPPEGIALLQKAPSGKPNVVVPDVAKLTIPKLKQDIPRYSLHFDPPTTKWWEDLIKNGGPVESENPQWVLPPFAVSQKMMQRESPPSPVIFRIPSSNWLKGRNGRWR